MDLSFPESEIETCLPNEVGIRCLEQEVEWTLAFVLTSWDIHFLQLDAVQYALNRGVDNIEVFVDGLEDTTFRPKTNRQQRGQNHGDVSFLVTWLDQTLLRSIEGLPIGRGEYFGPIRKTFPKLRKKVEMNKFMSRTMRE